VTSSDFSIRATIQDAIDKYSDKVAFNEEGVLAIIGKDKDAALQRVLSNEEA
jgi:hypothetical protein